MDIFRFENPNSPTKMENGQIINGLQSKMWIERYRDAGEFTIKASVDSGARELLPIGSFISHTNTKEIMIVEDHEISDNDDKTSIITITGRGLETYFDNRIVGSNVASDAIFFDNNKDYIIPSDYTWAQCIYIYNQHVDPLYIHDPDDAFPYLIFLSEVSSGRTVQRKVPKGPLYQALLQLLEIDNLGLKIIRPDPSSPLDKSYTRMVIHKGVDRRKSIVFSYPAGEVKNADYFWSNRNSKTAAHVMGTWIQKRVIEDGELYDRRMVLVDGSDIDQPLTSFPTGITRTNVEEALVDRGKDVISALRNIALTKVDTTNLVVKEKFRRDYDVGDLVSVNGNYNESALMRVSEYVEIEDENGEQGYPTLTVEDPSFIF